MLLTRLASFKIGESMYYPSFFSLPKIISIFVWICEEQIDFFLVTWLCKLDHSLKWNVVWSSHYMYKWMYRFSLFVIIVLLQIVFLYISNMFNFNVFRDLKLFNLDFVWKIGFFFSILKECEDLINFVYEKGENPIALGFMSLGVNAYPHED